MGFYLCPCKGIIRTSGERRFNRRKKADGRTPVLCNKIFQGQRRRSHSKILSFRPVINKSSLLKWAFIYVRVKGLFEPPEKGGSTAEKRRTGERRFCVTKFFKDSEGEAIAKSSRFDHCAKKNSLGNCFSA